jgi:hypothetical protein
VSDRYGFIGKYAIDAPAQTVHGVAERESWQLIVDVPRGTRTLRWLAWRTVDEREVHYREDHRAGVRVLLLVAHTADGLTGLRASVADLPLWTEADLLDRVDQAEDPAVLVEWLNMLSGVRSGTEPEADRGADVAVLDERWARVVARLADHPTRNVRRALLFTLANVVRYHPALAGPVLARRGEEHELGPLMDAFASLAGRVAASIAAQSPDKETLTQPDRAGGRSHS